MNEIILLTGGARSGKSSFAEQIAEKTGGDLVLYIATASVCDEEMADRVKKHRQRRPQTWKTYEGFWNFNGLRHEPSFLESRTVLIDCLGFMLNNIMFHLVSDWETCTVDEMNAVEECMIEEVETLISVVKEHKKNLVVVTNEVGMGLVPAERSSRYYRDILGRANRTVAEGADRVYFMVSGIPLIIKE